MTYRLVLRPQAQLEIAAAMDWYESERSGLGDEFGQAVETMLDVIQRNPEQYQQISAKLRRAVLHRFPYSIVYTVADEQVIIAGCVHNRSHPRRWIGRR